jgi:hypothetical protein
MTLFVGFDCLAYPGDAQMQWLKQNTNLSWCGYYIAPAPSHSDQSWMGERGSLSNSGWGLLAIYVGQQTSGPGSHNVNAAQGTLDGAGAAALAAAEGFPAGSFIYLDIEDGSALSDPAKGYLVAWATKLIEGNYAPGFYCSHLIAAAVASLLDGMNPTPVARIWAYKVPQTDPHPYTGNIASLPSPDPSSSGFGAATARQYEQNIILTLNGAPTASLTMDLSCANAPSPSSSAAEFQAMQAPVGMARKQPAAKALIARRKSAKKPNKPKLKTRPKKRVSRERGP